MSKEQSIVESLCQIYGDSIEKVFLKAVTHFYDLHKNELLIIRPATKAALINDYIYQYFQEEFENIKAFSFIDKPKGRFIGYDSEILIRIKKLSRARKPVINKTHAANQFNTQVDMDLIKNAKASNIYLGYVPNLKSGNIDNIAFAYPNETGTIAWTINIEEQLIQQTLDLNITPFDSEKDASGKHKHSRFVSKTAKRKKNQNDRD